MKRPGLVTVSIGEPIAPQDLSPQELNARVEEWIEAEVQRLRRDR
jgi:1-acyl-sn-glycerol-3-phosphate acyltransferase